MNVEVKKLGIGVVVTVDGCVILEVSHDTAWEILLEFERVLADIKFDGWISLVEKEVYKLELVQLDDMVDFNYRDAFEDGVDPAEAARMALELHGY